ncbi:hypothetical protein IMZ48_16720 [Candidatus Bathyarchaeota archaeon]|nr:hypothetical protein [Candidatus Bathyarchaeota archaeon]
MVGGEWENRVRRFGESAKWEDMGRAELVSTKTQTCSLTKALLLFFLGRLLLRRPKDEQEETWDKQEETWLGKHQK